MKPPRASLNRVVQDAIANAPRINDAGYLRHYDGLRADVFRADSGEIVMMVRPPKWLSADELAAAAARVVFDQRQYPLTLDRRKPHQRDVIMRLAMP